LLLVLGQVLAAFQFRRLEGKKIFGRLMDCIKDAIDPIEVKTFRSLTQDLIKVITGFFEENFEKLLPKEEIEKLNSILLRPYIERQLSSVNPIVFQPYIEPDGLSGEGGLHVSNRIHVLFTEKGTKAFVSGCQVFFLKDSKPDNRYKMTGSLWSSCRCSGLSAASGHRRRRSEGGRKLKKSEYRILNNESRITKE
jgi:hypothetical protein